MKRLLITGLLALVATACAGILGLRTADRGPKRFDHRAHTLKGISCVDCHTGMETAGDTGPLHLPPDDSCLGCHKEPHDTRSCSGCHRGDYTEHDLMQARKHLRFSHEKHLKTLKGNCVNCHRGVAEPGSLLRPTMATCLSCHQHKDQFKVRDCEGCHVDLPTEMTKPESHLVHGPDFVREHGVRSAAVSDLCATCHTESFCADCHARTAVTTPSNLAFDEPFGKGMHRAGFMSRHPEASRADPGMCSSCHTESSCRSCHESRGIAARVDDVRASPHPPGWVGVGPGQNRHGPAARRDPAGCASCHSGAGEQLCVSCHRVGGVGGNPHPPGFSSRREKSQVPCRACHITGAL